MNVTLRRLLRLLLIAGSVLVLDQVTKRLIVDNLVLHESRSIIPFLSPLFQITRSHNTGASFGILPNAGDIFAVIAIIVVIVMVYMFPRIPDEKRLMWLATGLICGGALGNVIDRLMYGYVVDFIHYQIPGLVSNVSNIADHAVVGGVILFFIASWRDEREKPAAVEPTNPDSVDQPPTP